MIADDICELGSGSGRVLDSESESNTEATLLLSSIVK